MAGNWPTWGQISLFCEKTVHFCEFLERFWFQVSENFLILEGKSDRRQCLLSLKDFEVESKPDSSFEISAPATEDRLVWKKGQIHFKDYSRGQISLGSNIKCGQKGISLNGRSCVRVDGPKKLYDLSNIKGMSTLRTTHFRVESFDLMRNSEKMTIQKTHSTLPVFVI